jgi:hypothetical protein
MAALPTNMLIYNILVTLNLVSDKEANLYLASKMNPLSNFKTYCSTLKMFKLDMRNSADKVRLFLLSLRIQCDNQTYLGLNKVLQNLARGTNSRSRRGKERMSVGGSSSVPLSSGAGNASLASMNAVTLGRSDGRERVNEGGGGPRSATDRPVSGTRSSSPSGNRMAAGRSRLRKT